MKLQPRLVVTELLARQPCPAEGILALFDLLLGRASSVVVAGDLIGLHGQVGDDEAHAGEQLARMPLDLGDDAARLVPGRSLILEVLVKALDLGL